MSSQAILDWLANGETGMSSKSLAFAALGVHQPHISYPFDPADLNRCIKLVRCSPVEVMMGMEALAYRSEVWASLFVHWGVLVSTFEEEVGIDWGKGRKLSATKTYQYMKELGC